MKPNLFLVVFDTARADAFEPWGAPAGATPTVSDLASRGAAFPMAFAPSNWTLPSHASMFTGVLPGPLGLTRLSAASGRAGRVRPLIEANTDRVLAEVLRRDGYSTRAISANPFIHKVNGFDIGFEEFRSVRGKDRPTLGTGIRSWGAWLMEAWRARADDGAANALNIVRRWVKQRDGRPFFWFVNLMECHSPYLPPRPHNDLNTFRRLMAGSDVVRFQRPGAMYRACVGELELSTASLARMRHLYRAAIGLMDHWLGRVLELFETNRLLDDTLFVVTADHGENLGERGLLGHVLSMDDRLLRAPLVMAGPDIPAVPELVSLAELPAMIAGPLGLASHPWTDEVRPGGFAVSQVAGDVLTSGGALARAWGVPQEAIRRIAEPMTAATDGRFKLVRGGGREHLFDLIADPSEALPLPPDTGAGKAPLAGLRAAIDHVDAAVPDVLPADVPATDDEETAELEERLRQLGYL